MTCTTVNRIAKYYDNEDIVLEYDGANVLLARYTHGAGIDEPLIMKRDLDLSGTFEAIEAFSYHADGLGSITDLTDSAGIVAQSYVYDSFGNIVAQTNTIANPYTYTGREFDSESGLYYYRARYYDPVVGRFINEDPVSGNLIQPQTLNKFPYVLNNPVNFIDPSGKNVVVVVSVIVGGGLIIATLVFAVAGINLRLETAEKLREKQRQALETCDLEGLTEADKEFRENVEVGIKQLELGLEAINVSTATTPGSQVQFIIQEVSQELSK